MTSIGNIFTLRRIVGDKTLIRELESQYLIVGVAKMIVNDDTNEMIVASPNELTLGETIDVYMLEYVDGIPYWDETGKYVYITKDKFIETLSIDGYSV